MMAALKPECYRVESENSDWDWNAEVSKLILGLTNPAKNYVRRLAVQMTKMPSIHASL